MIYEIHVKLLFIPKSILISNLTLIDNHIIKSTKIT
jgi:hypothetical protein